MIILEGADGSGKSTLKERILKAYPNLIDVSLTKLDPIVARQEMAMRGKEVTYNRITDRSFFISELVYSKILRGFNTPDTIWKPLYKQLYREDLVIICTGQGQDTRKDYDNDDDVWKRTQETKEQARKMYRGIAEVLGFVTYDFKVDPLEKIINLVRDYKNS